MEFATKIAVVVREDLAVWQKLNVTAFVAGGVASVGETVGQPYRDADGREYLPMLRQPVFVYSASKEKIRTVYERALRRGVRLAVYTEELFATSNDDDNRVRSRRTPGEFKGILRASHLKHHVRAIEWLIFVKILRR